MSHKFHNSWGFSPKEELKVVRSQFDPTIPSYEFHAILPSYEEDYPLGFLPFIGRCMIGDSNLRLTFNSYPYQENTLLYISEDRRVLSCLLSNDILNFLYIENTFGELFQNERVYSFLNQAGAGGSVLNRFHGQGIFMKEGEILPIEVVQQEELLRLRNGVVISRLVDYPIYVLTVSHQVKNQGFECIKDVAYQIIKLVDEEMDTSYNLTISQSTVRIIPRRSREDAEVSPYLKELSGDSEYGARIAGLEVSGLFVNSHNGLFLNLIQGKSASLEEKQLLNNFFEKALDGLGYTSKQQKRLEFRIKEVLNN